MSTSGKRVFEGFPNTASLLASVFSQFKFYREGMKVLLRKNPL
ncbi:MAG: hypothetical protein JETT_2799 [Candidatus Jettenia ecosi]|uniref:Uncharacterized protein n=1 Tax=Candidatus Jettenia ecosi TaxID=2494326 RepID=A0A533Q8H9_9BACT|nr:MAG: hypothetical protein JETT_2799 [Candidatus Jettenia ecosi]